MAMPTDVKRFRAVVAGPGDVQREVDLLQGVVALVNRIFRLSEANVVLELLHWRTDVYPGLHAPGSQGQADQCLRFEDCNLLLAIFWKRFGTPVYDAESGTEHEVRRAVKLWKLNGSPQVMVYFRHANDCPEAPDEAAQWEKVRHFRNELLSQQIIWDYEDERAFQMLALSHILQFVFDLLRRLKPSATIEPACRVTAIPRLVRAEGITELLGDLEVQMAGELPSTAPVKVHLFLNTAITNRLEDDGVTDALLLCLDSVHTVSAVRGRLVEVNELEFEFTSAGASLLRFANVRANAGALGVTNDHNITALVIIESIAIIEPVQVVAFVQRGLLFQRRTASGTAFADSQPVRLSQSVACSGQCILTLRFAEGFAGAFKTRATPLRANRLHPLITTSSSKAV